jgi:hypothetical protein
MKRRCDNPNNPAYRIYGGRGITYCHEWKTFDGFLKDMGLPTDKSLTLERKDNDAGYSPNNCVWASRKAQQNNTRLNHRIVFNGEFLTVTQLAERLRMPYGRLRNRLRDGWELSKAVTVPRHKHRSRAPLRQQPLEGNLVIECGCGCGQKFLRFDKRGRPRFVAWGHDKGGVATKRLLAAWEKERA